MLIQKIIPVFFTTSLLFAHLASHAQPWKINENNLIFSDIKNTYPDEISWCIADIKFDGKDVKVCEFGEARFSQFKGHETLFGTGKLWHEFWNFLNTFQLPIWFIHSNPQLEDAATQARETLARLGGKRVISLSKLPPPVTNKKKISKKHDGILILEKTADFNSTTTREYKKFENYLILGKATSDHFRTKHATNKLFSQTTVLHYKPQYKEYVKSSSISAQSIIQDFAPHSMFVIKPLAGSCGNGVIITDKKNLEKTLETIFGNNKTIRQNTTDSSISFWNKPSQHKFIVEAYAPSKPIRVADKPYDGTMRVIFSLFNMNGTMGIYFFDAYWKLPNKSLSDYGTLNEKHKSHISIKQSSSAPVESTDFAKVKEEMCLFLPVLYEKALSQMQ